MPFGRAHEKTLWCNRHFHQWIFSIFHPTRFGGAEIIVTLDQESDNFVENHAEVILGHVRPLGSFLPRGSSPYVSDPYERPDDENVDERYETIVSSVKLGCKNLLSELPALLQV